MERKFCSRCKKEKELNQFPFKNKKNGVYHSACVLCWKEIRKESYNRNKQTTLNRNLKNKKRNQEWYRDFKSKLKCEKCGETHIACLDFHHQDRNSKEFEVSNLIYNTYSLEKIMREVEKCIILCSNCHRKLHYVENN